MPFKILFADDNMTAQNTGRKLLTDAGYNVVPVSNGAAALKKFASENPDLLVLDVFMPGYSGLEVCEKVKAQANVPVVLTYSKMEPFRAEDGERVHADAAVAKPLDDLVATVARLTANLVPKPQPEKSAQKSNAEVAAPEPPKIQTQPEFAPVLEPDPHAEEHTVSLSPAESHFESNEPSIAVHEPGVSLEPPAAEPNPQPVVDLQPATTDFALVFEAATAASLATASEAQPEPQGEAGNDPLIGFGQRSGFIATSVADVPAFGAAYVAHSPAAALAPVLSSMQSGDSEAVATAVLTAPQDPVETSQPEAPPESWWTAEPLPESAAAEAGVALQPVGESQSNEEPNPVDLFAVFAQLTGAAEPDARSESEPVAQLATAEEMTRELSLATSLDFVPAEPEPNAAPTELPDLAMISDSAQTPAPLQNEVVVAPVEPPTYATPAAPSSPLAPTSKDQLEAQAAAAPNNEEVSAAVERVFARFKDSLLSEILRELAAK